MRKVRTLNLPLNRRLAVLLQVDIRLAEGLGAKKTPIGGVRRRVSGFEHEVLAGVNDFAFFLRVSSPEDKYNVLLLLRHSLDHHIGELLPSFLLVRAWFSGPNSKGSV